MVKNFHDNDWSNDCSSRNCCRSSGLWVHYSRKRVFSASKSDLPNTVVLVRSSFVVHTSRYRVPERCKFANPCEWNYFVQRFEVMNLASCFQMLVLEEIPKVVLLVTSHMSIHLWSRILSVFLVPSSSFVKPNCPHQNS